MKRIKILRIIARLNIGGPAIHTILLTQGLDRAKFDTVFICGKTDEQEGDMFYYCHEKNIEPIFIPELRRELNFFNDTAAFRKIYNIIRIVEPDIIHTHTAKAGTLGRIAGIVFNLTKHSKDKKIRLIHTFHGHIFEGYFGRLKTGLFILIERILSLFTSKIITVSDSLRKELIHLKIAKENKIEVIPLGFELGNFLKIPPRQDKLLRVGIIGRLVPIKNHRLFLEAAAKVISDNQGMQLKFEVIGDGELRKDLEEYSHKLNIQKQLSFLGWQKDLVNVYSNLDIVALTSINEGTPVSLIEAMASARAVVATDVGGIKDLLGNELEPHPDDGFNVLERGIIVKPYEVGSFANALKFILQNDCLRKELVLRARRYAENKFTKERLIGDIDRLYKSLFDIE